MGCCLRRPHPECLGSLPVGALRARLPSSVAAGRNGLLTQAHYPAKASASTPPLERAPWFRREVARALAVGYGLPRCLIQSIVRGVPIPDPPRLPSREGAPAEGWPLIIFSAGVYGSCEMYTQFCRELAAQGAIVMAVEHEDGSGIYATSGATGEPIPYVDRPKGVDEETFRQPFLKKRDQELSESIGAIADFLQEEDVAWAQGEEERALADVLRCGNPAHLLLVGHSFGAAGIVRHLGQQLGPGTPLHPPPRGALLLDLWTDSLPAEELRRGLRVPFAQVLSDGWEAERCHWLSEASGDSCLGAVCVRGTEHTWVSESQLLAPAWLLRCIGYMGRGSYKRCLRATVRAVWLCLQAFADDGRQSRTDFLAGLVAVDRSLVTVVWPSEAPQGRVAAWAAPPGSEP